MAQTLQKSLGHFCLRRELRQYSTGDSYKFGADMPYAKGCKPGDSKRADKKWPKLPPPVKVPPPVR